MLFAELHGKLDPNASDLERGEDVLTSTTFGTLLVARATDVLVDWLNCARRLGAGGRLDHELFGLVYEPPVKYWFWPSLTGGTQPDVVLRIGHRLLVIEAKYGSTKSPAATDPEVVGDADPAAVASDQLLREWRAIQPEVTGLGWYPNELREAIEECDSDLVYLVSARRTQSALRELRDSQEKIRVVLKHNISLWLLTWQDLHGVLVRRSLGPTETPPWLLELARLLDRRRNLAAFLGFPQALRELGQQSDTLMRWSNQWSKERFADIFSALRNLDLPRFHHTVSVVEAWAAERRDQRQVPYFDQLRRLDLRSVERLLDYLERQQIQ